MDVLRRFMIRKRFKLGETPTSEDFKEANDSPAAKPIQKITFEQFQDVDTLEKSFPFLTGNKDDLKRLVDSIKLDKVKEKDDIQAGGYKRRRRKKTKRKKGTKLKVFFL